MKKLKLILVLLISFYIEAQTMYVRPVLGAQSTFDTDHINKLTFSSGNLVIDTSDTGNGTFALADLRYLSFNDFALGIDNVEPNAVGCILYPNPVNDLLHFSFPRNENSFRIDVLGLDGKILLQQTFLNTNQPQLSVAALPSGLYLCVISLWDSTRTYKFIKQ